MHNSEKLILKEELGRIRGLHQCLFLIFFLAEIVELFWGPGGQSLLKIFRILFWLLFFRFFNKTVKRQLYSFWTFAICFGVYCSYKFLQLVLSPDAFLIAFPYFFTGMILIAECYLFSTPIFFPRIRWWEYDFRYRADLPIEIQLQEKTFKGRLTDLRRGSGCIVLFEDLPLGEKVEILIQNEIKKVSDNKRLLAQLLTKREFTPGRGLNYGVKFIFKTADESKRFKLLTRIWKKYNRHKFKSRFLGKRNVFNEH